MVATDPIVVLIPKRHIETWIRAALGEAVNENDGYKKPEPKKHEVRSAANEIYGWARGTHPMVRHASTRFMCHYLSGGRSANERSRTLVARSQSD